MGYIMNKELFQEIRERNPRLPSQAKIARMAELSPKTLYMIQKKNSPAMIGEDSKNRLANFIGIPTDHPVFIKIC